MVVAVAALVAVQIQTTPEHNWHNPRNMSHVLTSYWGQAGASLYCISEQKMLNSLYVQQYKWSKQSACTTSLHKNDTVRSILFGSKSVKKGSIINFQFDGTLFSKTFWSEVKALKRHPNLLHRWDNFSLRKRRIAQSQTVQNNRIPFWGWLGWLRFAEGS